MIGGGEEEGSGVCDVIVSYGSIQNQYITSFTNRTCSLW